MKNLVSFFLVALMCCMSAFPVSGQIPLPMEEGQDMTLNAFAAMCLTARNLNGGDSLIQDTVCGKLSLAFSKGIEQCPENRGLVEVPRPVLGQWTYEEMVMVLANSNGTPSNLGAYAMVCNAINRAHRENPIFKYLVYSKDSNKLPVIFAPGTTHHPHISLFDMWGGTRLTWIGQVVTLPKTLFWSDQSRETLENVCYRRGELIDCEVIPYSNMALTVDPLCSYEDVEARRCQGIILTRAIPAESSFNMNYAGQALTGQSVTYNRKVHVRSQLQQVGNEWKLTGNSVQVLEEPQNAASR